MRYTTNRTKAREKEIEKKGDGQDRKSQGRNQQRDSLAVLAGSGPESQRQPPVWPIDEVLRTVQVPKNRQ